LLDSSQYSCQIITHNLHLFAHFVSTSPHVTHKEIGRDIGTIGDSAPAALVLEVLVVTAVVIFLKVLSSTVSNQR
jgi:hypothetical protein